MIQNGKIRFYIEIFYRIVHLCCTVFELDRGKPPLSTEQYNKFIDFWSINYRFRFETILLQEFVWDPLYKIKFYQDKKNYISSVKNVLKSQKLKVILVFSFEHLIKLKA